MGKPDQNAILAEQLARLGLSAAVRITAFQLLTFNNKRPGNDMWPSIDSIAKRTGHSRSTVKRHLAALEEAGVIKITDRSKQRKSNLYRFPLIVAAAAKYAREVVASVTAEDEPLSSGPLSTGPDEPLSSGPKSEPQVSSKRDQSAAHAVTRSAEAPLAPASAAQSEFKCSAVVLKDLQKFAVSVEPRDVLTADEQTLATSRTVWQDLTELVRTNPDFADGVIEHQGPAAYPNAMLLVVSFPDRHDESWRERVGHAVLAALRAAEAGVRV